MSSSGPRSEWLDYARFAAAIGVMLYHYTVNGYPDQPDAPVTYFPILSEAFAYGYLGVDLFFIISGYVIVQSAQGRSAGFFAASRVMRLYPAFLFCLCLTSTVLVLFGGRIDLVQFAANLTMMPMRFGQPFVDGVYWSLTYEIFFYAVVFALISFGMLRHLNLFVLGWSLAAAASYLLGVRPFLLSGYFTLFAGGCALYLVRTTRQPTAIFSLLVCAALSMWEAFKRHPETNASHPSLAAVIVGGFFAAFLFAQHSPLAHRKLPASVQLGALSYPVYLLHFDLGILALNAIATPDNLYAALLLVAVAVVLVALTVVMLIERPVRALLTPFAERYLAAPIDMGIAKASAAVGRP